MTTPPPAGAAPAPAPDFTTEPDGTRVRKLLKPIQGHHGMVAEVRLRPPSYRDYMQLGDPSALIFMAGGMLPQEDLGVVQRYIERLLLGCDALVIEQADYRDAMVLKAMVMDFFRASASSSTAAPTP